MNEKPLLILVSTTFDFNETLREYYENGWRIKENSVSMKCMKSDGLYFFCILQQTKSEKE